MTMIAHNYLFKFFILANVCLTLGLLLNYALPPLISQVIDKQIALSQDSQTYPLWKEPPVPIYQKFYFYNVTNAHEIEQFGHKPQLVEIGPFTYRTNMNKRDIEFKSSSSSNNLNNQQPSDGLQDVISFKNFKSWHFEPEMSIADQSFEIVTLNAPLAITLTLIQSASNAVRLLVTFSLDGLSEGFFTRRSIKQLLFDGYPDLLTTFGPLLNAEMLSQGGHFGYMNARNNSLDGTYEINSGVADIGKLNTILKYNGRSKLPYWHDSPAHCNSLEGATTGEMFPRNSGPIGVASDSNNNMQASPSIKLFQPDFCRVWRLDLESEFEQPSSGLHLQRFQATRDIFKNSTELPENSCFFAHHRRNQHHRAQNHANNRVGRHNRQQTISAGQTQARQQQTPTTHHNNNNRQQAAANTRVRQEWPSGVFSLAPCKFNAPIYMSMPHFLDADNYFLSQVSGLEPDREKHEFYLDLEPRTGAPISLKARVQLNVAISKPPGLVRFRNVPEIMFPVFWQELSVQLSGPVLEQLHLAARGAQEANTRISYTFLILGLAILTTTSLFYLHARFVRGETTAATETPLKTDGAKPKPAAPKTQPPEAVAGAIMSIVVQAKPQAAE